MYTQRKRQATAGFIPMCEMQLHQASTAARGTRPGYKLQATYNVNAHDRVRTSSWIECIITIEDTT